MRTIAYPVIITNQGIVLGMPDERKLITCTSRGFKNRWYEDLHIYDSNMMEHVVKDAKKIKTVWSLKRLIFMDPHLLIELTYQGEPKRVGLEKIKSKVIKLIKSNRGLYTSMGTIQEMEKLVSTKKSVSELAEMFC